MNDVDVRRIRASLVYSRARRETIVARRRGSTARRTPPGEGKVSRFRLASVSPSSRLRLTFVDPTRPAWVPPGVLRRPDSDVSVFPHVSSLSARRLLRLHERSRVGSFRGTAFESRETLRRHAFVHRRGRGIFFPRIFAGCLRRLRRPERDIELRDGGGVPRFPRRVTRAIDAREERAPSGHRAERPRGFFAVLLRRPRRSQMRQATQPRRRRRRRERHARIQRSKSIRGERLDVAVIDVKDANGRTRFGAFAHSRAIPLVVPGESRGDDGAATGRGASPLVAAGVRFWSSAWSLATASAASERCAKNVAPSTTSVRVSASVSRAREASSPVPTAAASRRAAAPPPPPSPPQPLGTSPSTSPRERASQPPARREASRRPSVARG